MKKTLRKPLVPLVHLALFSLLGLCCYAAAHIVFHRRRGPTEPFARAKWLASMHPLIDTHNDLPISMRAKGVVDLDISKLGPEYMTDIARMRMGGMGGQFWSAFTPCPAMSLPTDPSPVKFTLEQIDLIKQIVKANSNDLELATTAADIERIFQAGKIASLIGIEGGHQIDNSTAVLRQYRELGVLYMTLTHSCHTPWADSCTPAPVLGGLSTWGKEIVHEMNRIGMMVDIAHVSHEVMRHVIQVSAAPLFSSHSAAFALCNTTRNIPDFVLEAMAEKDGVIMINFWKALVTCSDRATLKDVADHISYIASVAGPSHIGMGADLDGIGLNDVPEGLEDVSKYPYLFAELIKRGFSDHDIVGIMGGNLLRVSRLD
ncbi:dipeptidase 1 (renal) [Kappamyces sp. JEL0829]|nr:dipeptidase 1 (renal) [Kappamyces sp. JEL0829]